MEEKKRHHTFKKSFLHFAEEYDKNLTASRDKIITRIILLNGGGLVPVMAFLLNPSTSLHPFRYTTMFFALGLISGFMISIFDYLYDKQIFNKLIAKAPKLEEEIPDSTNFFKEALVPNKFARWLRKLSKNFIYIGCLSFILGRGCGAYDFLSLTGFTHTELLSQKIECPEICSFLNKPLSSEKTTVQYSKTTDAPIKH